MEIVTWFQKVVTQHYFDFNGRARRSEFWYYTLCYFIIAIALSILDGMLGFANMLASLLALALLLPSLGVGVRRLHDIDRSGWWILIGLIPLVGWIVLIYWYAQPGTAGSNQFGADPKAGTAAAAA